MKYDCVSCGAEIESPKQVQPHCHNDECNIGYAKWLYGQNIVPDGDHLIWQGRLRKGCPVIKVRREPGRSPLELPARGIGMIMEGHEILPRRKFRNECGNKLCVAPKHHSISDPRKPELLGHLDPAPLTEWVNRKRRLDFNREDPIPNRMAQSLRDSKRRGYITVRKVDEICCDWLGMHPADIYGDEFFTA